MTLQWNLMAAAAGVIAMENPLINKGIYIYFNLLEEKKKRI